MARKITPVEHIHAGDILIDTDPYTGGERSLIVESADWNHDREGMLYGYFYFTNDTDKYVRVGDEVIRAGRVK